MPRYGPAGWVLLLIVAATCFGIGLAVALISPLLAWLLLPPSRARTATVRAFCSVTLATPLPYFGVMRLYVMLYGGDSQAPDLIALLQSPGLIATFTANLARAGIAGLCLGDLVDSRTFPNPASFIVAGLMLVALTIAFVRSPAPIRARLVAYAILALACYGSIAVARAAFVQRPPAAAREPRYHYVALLPLTLLLCELLRGVASRLRAAQAPVFMLAALATPVLSYDRPQPLLYNPIPARRKCSVSSSGFACLLPRRPVAARYVCPTERSRAFEKTSSPTRGCKFPDGRRCTRSSSPTIRSTDGASISWNATATCCKWHRGAGAVPASSWRPIAQRRSDVGILPEPTSLGRLADVGQRGAARAIVAHEPKQCAS
jgi:hypothetical protein